MLLTDFEHNFFFNLILAKKVTFRILISDISVLSVNFRIQVLVFAEFPTLVTAYGHAPFYHL